MNAAEITARTNVLAETVRATNRHEVIVRGDAGEEIGRLLLDARREPVAIEVYDGVGTLEAAFRIARRDQDGWGDGHRYLTWAGPAVSIDLGEVTCRRRAVVAYHSFFDFLVARGHATREEAMIQGPVTTSGSYAATNGFSYDVAWNNGRLRVDVHHGYSAAAVQARRQAEAAVGGLCDETWDAYLAAVVAALGLAT